jgi:two-component system OmpR family response regulator
MRLLVVEDERDLASALTRALVEAEFAVDVAHDGDDALDRALGVEYDAILLDLLLPGRSGWAVLEALRAAGRTTPVLVLTARDAIEDRVRGLNLGADDYLSKPFAVDELVARIGAIVRRAAGRASPVVCLGDLEIDLSARRVRRGSAEIELTAREFSIFDLLLRRRGAIVTRHAISDCLYDETSEYLSNAIDVHVASLRRKLGADVIRTRRGHGYFIDD